MKSGFSRETRAAVTAVNFEPLNDIPPINGMEKVEGEIVPGMTNIWYEYVPASYDGTTPVPLVIQNHGGGQDGLRWAVKCIWHEIAERQNLIVVFPNSPTPGMWCCDDTDIQYLYDLIAHLKEKYNIDGTRVFMQGMSNGDMMTLAFTMKHPEVLAGACYTSGPSLPEFIADERPVGPLPIIQERGEVDVNFMLSRDVEDVYEKRYHMNDFNREIWEPVNGTVGVLPALTIDGKNNFLCFRGEQAPLISWEIQGMGHREPVHSAQAYWDYLYSGCTNENGIHHFADPVKSLTGDDDVWIFALSSSKAYHKDGLLPISGLKQAVTRVLVPDGVPSFAPLDLHEMAQNEAYYIPCDAMETVFGGKVEYTADGREVTITLKDGTVVKGAENRCLIEVNGSYAELQKPFMNLFGTLYLPIEEFARQVMGLQVTTAHDVICVSGHYALLGKYTARILCRLMGGIMRPHEKVEWLA